VSSVRHNNYIDFTAKCEACYEVDNVKVDYSGVTSCLKTHTYVVIGVEGSMPETFNWTPPASLGGLRDVTNVNCKNEDTTITAYMRTRLVAPGFRVSLWRTLNNAPSTSFSLNCYSNTKVTYDCKKCD